MALSNYEFRLPCGCAICPGNQMIAICEEHVKALEQYQTTLYKFRKATIMSGGNKIRMPFQEKAECH